MNRLDVLRVWHYKLYYGLESPESILIQLLKLLQEVDTPGNTSSSKMKSPSDEDYMIQILLELARCSIAHRLVPDGLKYYKKAVSMILQSTDSYLYIRSMIWLEISNLVLKTYYC